MSSFVVRFFLPPKHLAVILLLTQLFLIDSSRAADPQPYTVKILPTKNAELDQLLTSASALISLNETAPVGAFALISRAKADVDRFSTALKSLGYYQGQVQIRIADRPLDDPGLFDTIDFSPAKPELPIVVSIETGPLFHLRHIDLQGELPEQAKQWLGLSSGAPAIAAKVLVARENLLASLLNAGYALAKVDEPIATLVAGENAIDVTYKVSAGKVAHLGAISVSGLDKLKEPYARQKLDIAKGDAFTPSGVESSRQNLLATGVFANVRSQVAEHLDPQGQLPINFIVDERKRHSTNLGAAYSTDLGATFSTLWQHHNLLGNAEQLNLSAGMTQLGGNSTTGIGYQFSVQFIKPDFFRLNQQLKTGIAAVRQNLDAYQQQSLQAEWGVLRTINKLWTGGLSLSVEQTNISQENTTRDYTLISTPLSLKYDSTDNLLNPSTGRILRMSITPIQPLAGFNVDTFAIFQVSGSSYLDLSHSGSSILAVRAMLGDIEGADRFDLPPDKRFYAGGSTTVRGFQYQSIGSQFASGNPEGGKAMVTGSVELRQKVYGNYGMAMFADAGQVSSDTLLLQGAWRVGAGVGARYYTGFGPLRVDVAFPVNAQSNSGSFELYIGLGQAF